jgi:hypothetical protein
MFLERNKLLRSLQSAMISVLCLVIIFIFLCGYLLPFNFGIILSVFAIFLILISELILLKFQLEIKNIEIRNHFEDLALDYLIRKGFMRNYNSSIDLPSAQEAYEYAKNDILNYTKGDEFREFIDSVENPLWGKYVAVLLGIAICVASFAFGRWLSAI